MRTITSMKPEYLLPSLELIEQVFTTQYNADEGKVVRALVEEIRSKKYYLPELELLMLEDGEIIGYVMFSRFHIEGKYTDRLVILTPAAVRGDRQRQGISKELIEYGKRKAAEIIADNVYFGDSKSGSTAGNTDPFSAPVQNFANLDIPDYELPF